MPVFTNRTIKKFPGWVITEANNYQLAKTAIKTGIRCRTSEVNLKETLDGKIQKYANVKQTNNGNI